MRGQTEATDKTNYGIDGKSLSGLPVDLRLYNACFVPRAVRRVLRWPNRFVRGMKTGAASDLIPYRTFVPFDRIHTVYVSIMPLRTLVNDILGDDFDIEVLVPSGASPETFEPSARQLFWSVHFGAFFRHLGFGSKCFSGKYLCGWSCFTRCPAFYRLFGCSRDKQNAEADDFSGLCSLRLSRFRPRHLPVFGACGSLLRIGK